MTAARAINTVEKWLAPNSGMNLSSHSREALALVVAAAKKKGVSA